MRDGPRGSSLFSSIGQHRRGDVHTTPPCGQPGPRSHRFAGRMCGIGTSSAQTRVREPERRLGRPYGGAPYTLGGPRWAGARCSTRSRDPALPALDASRGNGPPAAPDGWPPDTPSRLFATSHRGDRRTRPFKRCSLPRQRLDRPPGRRRPSVGSVDTRARAPVYSASGVPLAGRLRVCPSGHPPLRSHQPPFRGCRARFGGDPTRQLTRFEHEGLPCQPSASWSARAARRPSRR